MSDREVQVEQLLELLGNGKLDKMIRLSARIGQFSGMIDPFSGLDRKELREWRDKVVLALGGEAMSETFPPAMPKVKLLLPGEAMPDGTWVTGASPSGLQGWPGHQGHVLVVRGQPQIVQYANAGYQQEVWCWRCGEGATLDGEFCQVVADDDYIRADADHIQMTGIRLRMVYNMLVKDITGT